MPKQKPKLSDLLNELDTLSDSEERRYDDIPGWDGVSLEVMTESAVMIPIKGQDVWFPFSQLRKDDTDNVFASMWVLEQKGLT